MAAMRRTIQLAISRGVPTFNAGDHMGCAMIYRACATELLGSGHLSDETVAVLRSAVQDSQRGDATSAAWALREALDWCLASGAHNAPTRSTASDEPRVAATIIHEAISVGVPLFNAGDHAACADVYAAAARRLARLQLPTAAREQLTKAVDASNSRPTDRAWALRRALDSCLDATTGAHAGGRGGSGSGAHSGRAGGPVVLAQAVDERPTVLAYPADGIMLLDFTKGVGSDWQVVNDGVMGGVSRSTFGFVQAVSGGHAEFSGTLSFARNGGFASVRGKLPAGACAGALSLALSLARSLPPLLSL